MLCLVDEAQWLDRSSAEALTFAARRLDAEGVVCLFAARDGDRRDFPAPACRNRLQGLGPEPAAALLAGAGVDLPAEVVGRLVERTGGNPLALLELPGTLDPDQLAGRAPLEDVLPLPTRLERTFGERVRRLPDGARTLLLVAAAETTGDPAVVSGPVPGLGSSRRARPRRGGRAGPRRGRPPRFRHPLVRSAAYQTATLAARQAAHRAWPASSPARTAPTSGPGTWPRPRSGPTSRRRPSWSARPTGPAGGAGTPRPPPPWSGRPGSAATTTSGDAGWPRPPARPGWPARPDGPPPCWSGPGRWPPISRPRRPSPTCAGRSRPAGASPWRRRPCWSPGRSWPRPSTPARPCRCWSRRARSPATPGT